MQLREYINERYDNVAQAARALSITPSTLRHAYNKDTYWINMESKLIFVISSMGSKRQSPLSNSPRPRGQLINTVKLNDVQKEFQQQGYR